MFTFTQIAEKINLFSLNRGVNRFPGQLMAFKLLEEKKLFKFEGLQDFEDYINSGFPFSNSGLEDWLKANPSAFNEKVLEWSRLGDEYFEKLTQNIPPFDGVDGIMMGHVIVDAIDPEYPATLSRTLTTGYLREKLGFKGIIMTDAMRMKAIQDNYGTGTASVLAIKAGCDLVLLRGDEQHFLDGYEAILAAAKSGEISEEVLNASVLRILKAKEDAGLFENRFADPKIAKETVGKMEHQELLFKLASKSISVFREKVMPLKANDGKKIAVIGVEPQKIAAALDEKQCVDMLEKEVAAIHENTTGIVIKLNPDDEDIANAVEKAKDADVIILGMCSGIIFGNQVPLYNALKALGKDIIVVAMESPCDIELIPDCTDYIATYGAARDWMKVAAQRMFGLTDINAKAPITIPGVND